MLKFTHKSERRLVLERNIELISIRKQNRYTQSAMAAMLGVSYSLYQKLEYGLRKPTANFTARLFELFPREVEEGKK